MTKPPPLVHVLVLNYNSPDYTIECLRSLEKVDYPNYRVVVVDNGSTDGSPHLIRKEFENACLIETGKNLGFPGGNNVGIRQALTQGADYVLLLNNDTLVQRDFLAKMVEVGENDENVGIIGCKVYHYDRPNVIQFAGGRVNFWRGQIDLPFLNRTCDGTSKGVVETGFVPGCCMLVKRKVVEEVGTLDERFFFGCDDWDFSYRVYKHGYRLKVNLDTAIWHKVGASANRESPMVVYYNVRGRFLFMRKHASLLHRAFFYPYFLLGAAVRFIRWASRNKKELIGATFLGWRDFRGGHFRPRNFGKGEK